MCQADPSLGAYGDLIGNAAAAIRMMNDNQFFEAGAETLDEQTNAIPAEAESSVHVPEALPPRRLQPSGQQVKERLHTRCST